jgi:hypothetical protein
MAPVLSLPYRVVKFPLFFFMAGMAMKNVSYLGQKNRAAMSEVGRISDRRQLGRLRTVRYWMLGGGKRTFGYRPNCGR